MDKIILTDDREDYVCSVFKFWLFFRALKCIFCKKRTKRVPKNANFDTAPGRPWSLALSSELLVEHSQLDSPIHPNSGISINQSGRPSIRPPGVSVPPPPAAAIAIAAVLFMCILYRYMCCMQYYVNCKMQINAHFRDRPTDGNGNGTSQSVR